MIAVLVTEVGSFAPDEWSYRLETILPFREKPSAARKSIANGHTGEAVTELEEFIVQVEAFSDGRRLTPSVLLL